jgi:hypothetical protein
VLLYVAYQPYIPFSSEHRLNLDKSFALDSGQLVASCWLVAE